ncbi:hypothetical protein [Rhodococcus sp. DK17]|uniref:hypothetical protein n=1 Tax=Rhodococcus sp. DK17 TaxID=186196 RepID=UPI0012F6935B|nr:hypothetical protein [Rhodococcus sp. DK17]
MRVIGADFPPSLGDRDGIRNLPRRIILRGTDDRDAGDPQKTDHHELTHQLVTQEGAVDPETTDRRFQSLISYFVPHSGAQIPRGGRAQLAGLVEDRQRTTTRMSENGTPQHPYRRLKLVSEIRQL